MRLKALVVTALFGTLLGCGDDATTTRQGNGAFAESDGGAQDAAGGPSSVGAGSQTCDCSGMALPDICMVCSNSMGGMGSMGMDGMSGNGMTACAHFVCVQGMCEVQVCP